MVRRDFYTALVLIAFSAAVFFESWRMPIYQDRGGSLLTAPGLVPGALGIILGLCGIILLLQSILQRRPRPDGGAENLAVAVGAANVKTPPVPDTSSADTDPDAGTVEQTRAGNRRLVQMLVLGVGYGAGLIGLVPFWLATFIFVFLAIAILEWRREHPRAKRLRRLGAAFLVAAVTAVSVTYVFQEIFLVRLP